MEFSESSYSINESVGFIQVNLVLSNQSSTNVTIHVSNTPCTDDTAQGKVLYNDNHYVTMCI